MSIFYRLYDGIAMNVVKIVVHPIYLSGIHLRTGNPLLIAKIGKRSRDMPGQLRGIVVSSISGFNSCY